MGAESNMRGRVCAALVRLHAVAIENALDKGTPDVNCLAGWIELKQIDDWPRRESTPVQVHHFRPEQRTWLRARCEHGGNAWVLLRVGKEWLLLWGAQAASELGRLPRALLVNLAVRHWPDGLNEQELVETLLRSMPGVAP
jgi:hypothetical protein